MAILAAHLAQHNLENLLNIDRVARRAKINGAFIAYEKRLACLLLRLAQFINPPRSKLQCKGKDWKEAVERTCRVISSCFVVRETDKLVIFGAHQKGNSSLCHQKACSIQ